MTGSPWVLASTSGRESTTWSPRERSISEGSSVIVCDIQMDGRYLGATLGDRAAGLPDYTLALKGLAVGVAALERVVALLESWLLLPPAEQAGHPPALECTLGSLFDQSLTLSLGRRDDVLSGGRPVATVRYIAGRLTGELTFVTDQGCLRQFCQGIRAALSDETGALPAAPGVCESEPRP